MKIPSAIEVIAATAVLIVSWNANSEPDLSHYTVYWGSASAVYDHTETVTDTFAFVDIDTALAWFFAVTATDTAGNESLFSNEAVWPVIAPTPDTTRIYTITIADDQPLFFIIDGIRTDTAGRPITLKVKIEYKLAEKWHTINSGVDYSLDVDTLSIDVARLAQFTPFDSTSLVVSLVVAVSGDGERV